MRAVQLISRFRTPLTALGGALFAFLLVLLYLELNPPAGRYTDAEIERLAQERIDAITPAPAVEPEIYAMVRPSVVLLSRDLADGSGRDVGDGVVVDLNGSILTAYHVVAGSAQVNVQFADGSTAIGTVTQTEPERDLAIVSARLPETVPPATLAGGVRPGDRVLAIGAPLGLDGSVSAGIVSATGRSFVVQETGTVLENMIQFDAAVNPGNSGGPLVDYSGRVVGIVSGIINPTNQRVFIGLGSAVPIETAGSLIAPLG
jgi:S1-C subfamily serine protease